MTVVLKRKLIAAGFVLLMLFQTFSSVAFAAQTGSSAARKQALESKYGVGITFPSGESDASRSLYLDELEVALRDLSPSMVSQVSAYYRKTLGKSINFIYTYQYLPHGGMLGSFDPTTAQICLMTPQPNMVNGAGSVGYNSGTIAHEFGHAFYYMCLNRMGKEKVTEEWAALNQGLSYGAEYQSSDRVFASSYGSTNMVEDFAEVFKTAFSEYRRTVDGTGSTKNDLFGNDDTGVWAKTSYIRELIQKNITAPEAALANMEKSMGDRMAARSFNAGTAGAYKKGDVTQNGYCAEVDEARLTEYSVTMVTCYADGAEPTGSLAARAQWYRQQGEEVNWLSEYGFWQIGQSAQTINAGDLIPGAITFNLSNGVISGYNKEGGIGEFFMQGVAEKKFMLDFSSNRVDSVAKFNELSWDEQQACYTEYRAKEAESYVDFNSMTREEQREFLANAKW